MTLYQYYDGDMTHYLGLDNNAKIYYVDSEVGKHDRGYITVDEEGYKSACSSADMFDFKRMEWNF